MKANNPLWRSPEGSSRKRRKTLKKCEESENGLELCFKGGTGDGGRGGGVADWKWEVQSETKERTRRCDETGTRK